MGYDQAKDEAADLIQKELEKAGIEVNDDTKSIINNIIQFEIKSAGRDNPGVNKLNSGCADSIRQLFGGKDGKFNLDIEKICNISIECWVGVQMKNSYMSRSDIPEAYKAVLEPLNKLFEPIKEEYRQEKQLKEALDKVQETIEGLGNNEQVKKQMGSANAEMLGDIVEKMSDSLEGVVDQSQRAEILTKGIKEMQQVVENAEKQAGKGEFGKVMNVLKSALKVVGTLGLDKTAKLEFTAATFAMNNKNAEQIKAFSKEQRSTLTASTQSINKAQEGRGRR